MLNTLLSLACFLTIVCWTAGAYNRLMRLRTAALKSLNSWKDQIKIVQIADSLQNQELQNEVKMQMLHDEYVDAVLQYNHAIKQFPASIIAVLFSFKYVDTSSEINN